MATPEVTLKLHVAWWVQPLMRSAKAAAFALSPFMSEKRGDDLTRRVGLFIAERGVKCIAE